MDKAFFFFINNNNLYTRVTLILYQNIVPISLYISVEIVKTFAVKYQDDVYIYTHS
jgi:magnesium-transporting ATPase (P-type)